MRELMLKFLRSLCTFCAKICDSIKNHVHNGKEHPHQEFGDGYIFCKNILMPAIFPVFNLYTYEKNTAY